MFGCSRHTAMRQGVLSAGILAHRTALRAVYFQSGLMKPCEHEEESSELWILGEQTLGYIPVVLHSLRAEVVDRLCRGRSIGGHSKHAH